ncbi:uncharacterized protein LOC133818821 [Humulus lupulus]|uniref:uncharacterized protein LOC133818821 n=1 Tax=Humulus lupulus TaxID=3486 RepID=UPI002B40A52D|nr:uncharacterized protein LOC133818821 [Humulus lupulus]
MKAFYRQRKKKATANSKTKPPSSSSFSPKTPRAASLGSDVSQAPASVNLQDDYDKDEEVLRQFDLDIAYGPCSGMSRMARWERASRLGLNPPKEVEQLLNSPNVRPQCLWDSRI